ncbi:MAG: hypothetical protein P4M08_14430 [Oligoflexia bacterium]|nr:hypothetical protein [Oligoflexia bacterium]
MDFLETLGKSLPEKFPFYHLGEVAVAETPGAGLILADAAEIEIADRSALGIRLQGDVRATLLVLIDEELDLSIYSEIANILASRLATELSANHDLDLMISAPSAVSPARLASILQPGRNVFKKHYLHRYSGLTLPVDAVVIIDAPSGEVRA